MMHWGPGVLTCTVMSTPCVDPPPSPATLKVKVPVDAVEVVVTAIGELPAPPVGGVIGAGRVNAIPVGEFPTHEPENVTAELNPPIEVIIMVVDPLRPWIIDTVVDDAVIEKSGARFALVVVVVVDVGTISTGTSTVCVNDPLVAVTLRVYVPVEAVLPALMVRVELAEPPGVGVIGLGKLKLTSAGAVPTHEAASPTCEVKPSKAVT